MKPMLSVVITHKDEPLNLKRALRSFAGRSGVEVIVVDDGRIQTATNCARKCAEAVGARFIESPLGGGVPFAMQIGFNAAKGDWVHFASCNDDPHDGFVSHLARAIDNNISADSVVGSALWVDDESGASWPSRAGHLISHVAAIRRDRVHLCPELGCHSDWWMLRRCERVAFTEAARKTIHLRRGQYSDVDRNSESYRGLLDELVRRVEALPDRRRQEAIAECWFADFGLAGLAAIRRSPYRRAFWSTALVGRALMREAEIQGRKRLPPWARRLAAKLLL